MGNTISDLCGGKKEGSPGSILANPLSISPTHSGRPSLQKAKTSAKLPFAISPIETDVEALIERSKTMEVSPNEKSEITIEDFELVKVLGRGSFGKVYLALTKDTNEMVALKRMRKAEIEQSQTIESVIVERQVLQHSSHPFVVKLLYAFQNEHFVYLGIEYVESGELFHHLRQHRKFGESEAIFYAAEVLLAIQYLHEELGIIYRDLKPENVLVGADGHMKITDFGLSKIGDTAISLSGTPRYFAPEIITDLDQTYGPEVDWWSFGCFVYELLTGAPPFHHENKETLFEMILKGKPKFSATMSISARDLISSLLTIDPEKRLGKNGADEIKRHPFFSSVNWSMVYEKKIQPPFLPEVKEKPVFDEMGLADTPVLPGQIRYPEFTYRRKVDDGLLNQHHL